MGFEFKRFVPKQQPLHCILIGKQGAGKSSLLGSLAREPLLLIYNASGEAHSPDWAAKAAQDVYKADPENVYPVRIDECEANDSALFSEVYGEKVKFSFKAGDKLSPDFSWLKLRACLEFAKGSSVFKSVAIDSANALAPIIRGTSQWENFCKTSKGGHDNFKEADAYVDMYREIIAHFTSLKEKGMNVVMTCLAKPQFDSSGPAGENAIVPVLPAYGVVEQVIPMFMDICVVNTVEGKPALDFGVKAYRASKDQAGKIKKYLHIEPRLNCAPTGLQLEALYPDLWYIHDIVKAAEQQAKETEES